MKNYLLFFKISFINYIAIILSMEYVTARIWADIIFILFWGSVLYQVLYITFYRRKEGFKLLRTIARYFQYALFSISFVILLHYLYAFFFGYTQTTFTGHYVDSYMGFEAWSHMVFESIIYVPVLIITAIYTTIYSLATK